MQNAFEEVLGKVQQNTERIDKDLLRNKKRCGMLAYLVGLHINKSASLDGLNENQEQIILALVQEFKIWTNANIKGLSNH